MIMMTLRVNIIKVHVTVDDAESMRKTKVFPTVSLNAVGGRRTCSSNCVATTVDGQNPA